VFTAIAEHGHIVRDAHALLAGGMPLRTAVAALAIAVHGSVWPPNPTRHALSGCTNSQGQPPLSHLIGDLHLPAVSISWSKMPNS
jgi:hypothetical protein